jgi:hypothetical protein
MMTIWICPGGLFLGKEIKNALLLGGEEQGEISVP